MNGIDHYHQLLLLLILMNKMKVEIESKKWIKPAISTPSHLQKHQLSLIDQFQPSFYISVAFHFDNNHHELLQNTDKNRLISRLEESLSKVLTLYYPFAGRYIRDDYSICCQDQGLEFVVATVDRKLHQIVDEDGQLLLSGPQLDSDDVPVISIQVNVLSCGGLIIGFKCLHKVGDMPTFFTFIDAWASTCRLGTLDQVVAPSFNLSSLIPPRHHNYQRNKKASKKPNKYVLKQFVFTGESLSRLKSATNTNKSESNPSNYSRVELVTAIITKSLINVDRSRDVIRPLLVCQALSFRPRLINKLEKNTVGNLFIRLMAALDVANNESWDDLREVAGVIRKSIRDADSEMRNASDLGEVGRKVEKANKEFNEEAKKGEEKVNMVRFTSWCRFPFNEVNFGWGKPSLVSMIPLPFSYVALMDCKISSGDIGGIVAGVCLKDPDMASFELQPDILAYTHHPRTKIRSNI